MKKEFKIGMPLESNTDYFATDTEYHIYAKDAVEVCDGRYIALRANDTKEFNVFIFIKEKKNVTLDFGGATLVLHGKILPFLIDSCETVTVKNCNVTYDRPHYTEALIKEITPEYARLRLNENCPCRVEDGKLVPYCDSWENRRLNYNGRFYQAFDAETREGRGLSLVAMGNNPVQDPECKFAPQQIYTVEEDGEDILLKGNIPEYYKPNTVLVIEHELRSLANVFAIDTKDILIENYRILSGCGMGIYTYRVENITLDGLRLTYDEKSPCIVTNSADAVHSFGTSGKFEIRNCVFEGMIDDAINIHSNFRTVLRTDGTSIYTDLASCEEEASDLYRVGDEIAVYRGHTMEETARYTVLGIEAVDSRVKKFTVDRPAAAHAEGDLIECLTSNCDATIENCIFGKANSHMRFQSRGKFIMKNCESELPVLLSGDANFWFESGPITDLTVENCRFVGEHGKIRILSEVDSSEEAPYYHKNLKILNNEFDTDIPVNGGTADGIVFKGNKNRKDKQMKLVLTGCGDVDATDCTVERMEGKWNHMKLTISDPILVYAPEMNEAISRWGVYAIPRLWREPSGELIVRFNGEEDSSDIENMNRAPNLYFTSEDNGETWLLCEKGEENYSISVLTGIDPPYRKLNNGDTVYVRSVPNLPAIKDTPYQKEFFSTNKAEILHTYRFGDIPEECRRVMFGRIKGSSGICEEFETEMAFPEREIYVVSEANSDGTYVKVEEYVQPFIFRLPYFSAICELKNGDLAAVCCGQNPDVYDKYYSEVYLIVSSDGGKTWEKRSVIAGGIDEMPNGYGGDGCEISLTVDRNGDLYCVMRMDGSTDPRRDPDNVTDTMLCISRDGGYTWSEPRAVADSSVTPHIITLGDALLLIYGRPGVHVKYSTDRGETWSKPYSIIGTTLDEERKAGRSDFESKYQHPYSYSNTFWERISENEIILLYNDLRYPDKNGVPTKAAFVRKIKIEMEQK